MEKVYERINFENEPSTKTPLNATNLNKMDKAIDDLDNRIVSMNEELKENTVSKKNWEPNMFLGTDNEGNITEKDMKEQITLSMLSPYLQEVIMKVVLKEPLSNADTDNPSINPSGLWYEVRNLSADELIQCGYTCKYMAEYSYAQIPYSVAKTDRLTYVYFDIPVQYGYIYKFEYETTLASSNIGINILNSYGYSCVQSNKDYDPVNEYDDGWKTNGYEVEIPQFINGYAPRCVRITFKNNNNNGTINVGDVSLVKITRRKVQ